MKRISQAVTKAIVIVVALFAFGHAIASEDVVVSCVTAQQRYPWNGLVDIVVTITGDVSQVANYECAFVATNCATQAAIPVSALSKIGYDSISDDTCTRRYLWNATNDVGAVKIDDLALTITMQKQGGVQLWKNGPYWAECNVGATKPEEYGYYFWWGDTVGYRRNSNNDGWVSVEDGASFQFSSANCPTYGKDNSTLQSLGYIDSAGKLTSVYDAATQHLGTPWRMPTEAEFEALLNNCDTVWTMKNGVYGREIVGRGAYALKSIFLPATGLGNKYSIDVLGSNGNYWSSTPCYSSTAWYLVFSSGSINLYGGPRNLGRSVRPLREFEAGEGVTMHLSLDCQNGTRTANPVETIVYSSEWVECPDNAVVKVLVNGEVIASDTGSGTVDWEPRSNGVYTLTHQVMGGGEVQGETLIAQFKVEHFVSIESVTAQQRYPWNGLVDIVVTITGNVSQIANYECTFVATNCATQAAISIATISQVGADSISGNACTRRYLWNASSDVGEVKINDVALTVDMKEMGVQLWSNGPYWAECNVGATKPEEYGYYFWWGDTVGYKRNANNDGWVSIKDGTSFLFSSANCPTYNKDNSTLQSLGYIDLSGNLAAAHDAATQYLGAPWRMPTDAEVVALLRNCDNTWTMKNGVCGRLVTGRGAYALKSIFLPAAGRSYYSRYLQDSGSCGYYWPSTSPSDLPRHANSLGFSSNYMGRATAYYRYDGLSVRPLRDVVKTGSGSSANTDVAANASMTTYVSLDCRNEICVTSGPEHLVYSTQWECDAVDAVAEIAVNGQVVSSEIGSGVLDWSPTRDGTYTLTHTVLTNGVQAGETLTATFVAEGFSPEPPVISPVGGTTFETTSLSVSMSCASEGATIHFTTNGTTPTLESPVYKRFKIYGKTTVKAIAFYEDGTPSEMAIAEYARGTCEDPVITPVDGTTFLHKDQVVSIAMGNEGTLRYTLDGSDPTTNSAVYAGPFAICESTVVKAKVFSSSFFDSQVITANLTREWERVATPVITAASSFTGSKTKVSIACATEGATIRYTTNGNDPNSHSTEYAGPFEVMASCTIRAYAVLSDYANSEIASWSVEKLWGIGDALNVPDGKFTTSGDAGWVRDTEVSHDGLESMRSGAITHNQKSIFSGSVTGAGTLTFWWKTSCEQDDEFEWDHIEFVTDGVTNKLNGITDWQQVTCVFTNAGEHALTWTYIKDDVEQNGDDCAWVDELVWTPASDPIPDLGENPTTEEITNVFVEAKAEDPKLAEKITTETAYTNFSAWAKKVQPHGGGDAVGAAGVMAAPNAWVSYALGSETLLEAAPTDADLTVESFEPKSGEDGKFDFTVSVKDVEVGGAATTEAQKEAVKENLKQVFGLEGGTTLEEGEMKAANVDIEFGAPQDGKVKFTAGPKDTGAKTFFMKVKVK